MTTVWGLALVAGSVVLVVTGAYFADLYTAKQRAKKLDARLDKILADR